MQVHPSASCLSLDRSFSWCLQAERWRPNGAFGTTGSAACHLITLESPIHQHHTDMGLGKSLLEPFKKLKHGLTGVNCTQGEGSGNENDRERGEANIERSEASQRSSRLHSEVEVVEIGSNQEGDSNDVDSLISPTPIPPDLVSASAESLLCGVSESPDAFGPLKSVVRGLYFILENCEVQSFPQYTIRNTYRCSGQ